MIKTYCTRCRQEAPEGRIWSSCAWRDAEGKRRAYKHSLCVLCVSTHLAPVWTACREASMTCPNCHIGTEDTYDAVYGSFIPKHVGPMRFEAPFCNACAAHFRIWFMQNAIEMEDRYPSGEGPITSPSPTAEQVLASLGITDPLP